MKEDTTKEAMTNKRPLMNIASSLKVYITQDSDGYVQVWDKMPKINVKGGYWEVEGDDSILLRPVIRPYTTKWEKSLITPNSIRKEKNEEKIIAATSLINEPATFETKCQAILDCYGVESQSRLLAEECCELAKEILKGIRSGYDNRKLIIEEIADVEIMIKQIKIALEISPEEVCMVQSHKLSRQLKRIREEND